mmetsp:Transcript_29942/g.60775  ORF Transcript_29942/g.60775 Transcript_29942/m.60775 type:complete len:149 (+) Transcript_29942:534-980(+)
MNSLKPSFASIQSAQDIAVWTEKSHNMLVILDCHISWSGPCLSLKPVFEGIGKQHAIEGCSSRLAVVTMEVPKYTETFQNLFDDEKTQSAALTSRGCRPLFAFVKGGEVLALVEDANIPELESLIMKHIPPYSETDSSEKEDNTAPQE